MFLSHRWPIDSNQSNLSFEWEKTLRSKISILIRERLKGLGI